ncbi:MAG: glycosyltransferase family 4 protein, partial [Planctomycetales bacterium]
RIRTLNLVRRLASRHRLTYLCYRNADPSEAAEAEKFFRELGARVEFVAPATAASRKQGAAFYARLALNLLSPHPYSVQAHLDPRMRQAIASMDADGAVDLWHCEWTPYAASFPRNLKRPLAIMAHNVESLIWRRYRDAETNPLKRWYIDHQRRKFERFERDAFARATRVITVSDADAELARREFGAERLSVVDNGVDPDYFQPGESPRNQNEIVFLGSLDWRPNLDGVRMLLDSIFPLVRQEHAAAKLLLVGRKPPEWLTQRAAREPGVELHADVPDVRPFLQQSAAMVVPLRIGGGSRLKILEAGACELPVVSTRIGAEGLELIDGEHYRAADDPAEIADALLDCIRDPKSAAELGTAARAQVERRYHWDVLAEDLDAVWRECATLSKAATSRQRATQGART